MGRQASYSRGKWLFPCRPFFPFVHWTRVAHSCNPPAREDTLSPTLHLPPSSSNHTSGTYRKHSPGLEAEDITVNEAKTLACWSRNSGCRDRPEIRHICKTSLSDGSEEKRAVG